MSVISTLRRDCMGRLEELYRVLEGSGIGAWQLQACSPMGNAARGLDWRIDPAEVIAFVMRHRAEAPFMLGAADNVGYFTDEELRLRGADGACFQGCRAGISAIGIDSAGNVRGCESLYDERFNEGNLRQRRLRDIWEDPGAFAYNRQFRREMLTGQCARCRMGPWCAGGVPVVQLFRAREAVRKSGVCRRGQIRGRQSRPPLRIFYRQFACRGRVLPDPKATDRWAGWSPRPCGALTAGHPVGRAIRRIPQKKTAAVSRSLFSEMGFIGPCRTPGTPAPAAGGWAGAGDRPFRTCRT